MSKKLLNILLVGAAIYGAYKLGEQRGEKKSGDENPPKPKNKGLINTDVVVDKFNDLMDKIENKKK